MKNSKIIIALMISALYFTSCRREQDTADTSIATDNYTATQESNGIIDAINSAAFDNGVLKLDEANASTSTLLPECATVTIDTVSNPKSISIEFASDGNGCLCTDWDNKYRKGKITATWTGKYRNEGTIIQVKTDNYFVGGNQFDYLKTVTNNGLNLNGNLSFSVDVQKANIYFSDNTSFTSTASRTREWISGSNTLTPYDDVYSITGSASGVSRAGDNFTYTITSPLNIAIGCRWIRKGVIVVTPDSKPARTIDFGDGSCDNKATVEINGTVYDVNL
jgi:hypothetical protein